MSETVGVDFEGLAEELRRALHTLRASGPQGLAAGKGGPLETDAPASARLEELERRGLAVRQKGRWLATEHSRYRLGVFRRIRRKLSLVELHQRTPGQRVRKLTVRDADRRGARDGDTVLVRRVFGRTPERSETAAHPLAEVTRIVARRRRRLVARVEKVRGGQLVLQPYDPRLRHDCRDVELKPGKLKKNLGSWVVVELSEDRKGRLEGRVSRRIGAVEEPGVDALVVCAHYEMATEWSEEESLEARAADALPVEEEPSSGPVRSSFAGLPTVTIDGASAKDFDDAITVQQRPSGDVRLMVHVADVAHYVQPDRALDRAARARGTSVYFPERVVPMLPPELSDDLCSLRPGVLRYAMTVEMDFDQGGTRRRTRFYNSVIRSDHRLTYPEVARFLERGKAPKGLKPELAEMLSLAGELMARLKVQRRDRGALQFERAGGEEISLGGDLKVLRREKVGTRSQQLIEEFMLIANEAVAEALADEQRRQLEHGRREEYLFRHHPPADTDWLQEAWAALLPAEPPLPESAEPRRLVKELQLRLAERNPTLFSQMVMRSLSRATYTSTSTGHFALGLENYCHFTSPIRRYPDLVMHRRLKELIARQRARRRGGEALQPRANASPPATSATELSAAEKQAEKAERELRKWRAVRFLESRVGEVFRATVTGALEFGLFVQLEGIGVDGLLPVDSLDDDWYELARSGLQLVGRSSARRIGLGDELDVMVSEVDPDRRRILVALVPASGKATKKRKTGSSRRRNKERRG